MTDTTDVALDALVARCRDENIGGYECAEAITALREQVKDYEDVLADKRRLTRLIDVAMHGEDGAAQQASLCDLVHSAATLRTERDKFEAAFWEAEGKLSTMTAERDALRERLATADELINGGLDDAAMAIIAAERAEVLQLRAERDAQQSCKDAAYLERNKLVALLAAIFPAGTKRTAIEGWSEDWHGCVYIDFPWGQASWHYHDSQAHLFAHLQPYHGEWDGHTTDEKYAAIVGASLKVPTSAVYGYLADIRGEFSCHPDIYKGSEQYTRTAAITKEPPHER